MKRLLNIFIVCMICLSAKAQWVWQNPMDIDYPVIQNQACSKEIVKSYTRMPNRMKSKVRKPLWDLSRNSAGLAIHFYSNAPKIKVRYQVSGVYAMPHMSTTGVSGIDLYSIDSSGKWNICSGNYSFRDTICYYYEGLGKDDFHNRGFEYRLYLPLYNSVKWLEIGTQEGTELTFIPQSLEKPIVLYGTSIAQGACSSRPGMAWANILQRSLDYPLINWGFSGNGLLENEVLNYIIEQDARLYILDCLPNLTQKTNEEVTDLIVHAVRLIREKRNAPILLVEHAGYSNAFTNREQYELYTRLNAASYKGYEILLKEGVNDLHYLSHESLNFPPDAWVDCVHLSDLGASCQAVAVEKKIRDILHIPVGDRPTMCPVTQRREPDTYEWRKRHHDLLKHLRQNPPKAVILGNSITHFWGGEPIFPIASGKESWRETMAPAGYQNLGYGYDRVENVLWRIHHGELDGYEVNKVVLMIGTNNMGISSDEDIVEGLRFLIAAIRNRQPKTSVKVIGILPRRAHEEWVKEINRRIMVMANEEGCQYCDVGQSLLLPNGKINESFFRDGLHPNEKGYRRIANKII
ncbi:SGNH/GDSL hydrolase family protein [uncultured Parabacteroides sp.]|uniref:SGNH/GDSL hydrolase family protein n=1 Tax=uncultured Parabacteroides sp. TaxID=512312 RepID=UPI00259A614C|nr:SGNH/GDSL hydrolase family protein [uncultured Parabacteroides sp.]